MKKILAKARDYIVAHPVVVRAALGLLISLGALTIADAQADAISAAIIVLVTSITAGAKPAKDAAKNAKKARQEVKAEKRKAARKEARKAAKAAKAEEETNYDPPTIYMPINGTSPVSVTPNEWADGDSEDREIDIAYYGE